MMSFELSLAVVLAIRRMLRVPVRAYLQVPYAGGAKKLLLLTFLFCK
jgi:hypothetical protein